MAFCGNFVNISDCRAFGLFETVPAGHIAGYPAKRTSLVVSYYRDDY